MTPEHVSLLGAAEIRRIAEQLELRPTKTLGQNFVHDANTVRRIVTVSGVGKGDRVLEVGPGLGSLTLALLDAAAAVTAVEIDPRLAGRLPQTVAEHAPGRLAALTVITADALGLRAADLVPAPAARVTAELPTAVTAAPEPPTAAAPSVTAELPTAVTAAPEPPTALVANLPYNVAVPVLLHLLSELPSIRRVLVMVQAEVADRLAAPPGSRTYGSPSVKAAWYGTARRAGSVSRSVFWPVPGVDSALVALDRHVEPRTADRRAVFAVIDAAFAQRRKMVRSALAGWAGSPACAEEILRAAGVDPGARGEALDIDAFIRIAAAGRDRLEMGALR